MVFCAHAHVVQPGTAYLPRQNTKYTTERVQHAYIIIVHAIGPTNTKHRMLIVHCQMVHYIT